MKGQGHAVSHLYIGWSPQARGQYRAWPLASKQTWVAAAWPAEKASRCAPLRSSHTFTQPSASAVATWRPCSNHYIVTLGLLHAVTQNDSASCIRSKTPAALPSTLKITSAHLSHAGLCHVHFPLH